MPFPNGLSPWPGWPWLPYTEASPFLGFLCTPLFFPSLGAPKAEPILTPLQPGLCSPRPSLCLEHSLSPQVHFLLNSLLPTGCRGSSHISRAQSAARLPACLLSSCVTRKHCLPLCLHSLIGKCGGITKCSLDRALRTPE